MCTETPTRAALQRRTNVPPDHIYIYKLRRSMVDGEYTWIVKTRHKLTKTKNVVSANLKVF